MLISSGSALRRVTWAGKGSCLFIKIVFLKEANVKEIQYFFIVKLGVVRLFCPYCKSQF